MKTVPNCDIRIMFYFCGLLDSFPLSLVIKTLLLSLSEQLSKHLTSM